MTRNLFVLVALAFLWIDSGCGGGSKSATPTQETCAGYSDPQASQYVLPYPVGQAYAVTQGNCSGYGHVQTLKYGYDFDFPIGALITASRDGVVDYVRQMYQDGDLVKGHENVVMVAHGDGTWAAYAHLTHNGALVAVGDKVKAGDPIGYSGNTGWTGGFRHLHFGISPCGQPDRCGTLPVSFRNADPASQVLQVNQVYAAKQF